MIPTSALLAILTSLTASLANAATFCIPTQFTCTIQSDPFVSPFSGAVYELHSAGTFYAINSQDMSLQVVVGQHYSQNLAKDVLVVDQVKYTCGSETQTFTTANVPPSKQFTCKAGTCASTNCLVTIGQGLDPIPNVQISQILYEGTQGLGGLCYNNDSSCPNPSSTNPQPPTPNTPNGPVYVSSTKTATAAVPAANTPNTYGPPPIVTKTTAAIPAANTPVVVYAPPPVVVKTTEAIVVPPPKPTTATIPAANTPPVYVLTVPLAGSTPVATPIAKQIGTPLATPAKSINLSQGGGSGNIFQSLGTKTLSTASVLSCMMGMVFIL
ncbi:UNVERIFIED_CONTAM: hypothetical protein HDU68_003773 [Siphonaria sp. JEL0065]|nr:hypothetical protein HDU68_003773 [Siphonaria sp. JEL0065]